jgi:hypothetical protein
MDADEYKRATCSPDAFRTAELEATVRVLRANRSPLADAVSRIARTPIPKPALHTGGPETDFFRVDASFEFVDELVGELLDAEAAAVSPEGHTTPEASHRASLVGRWTRYSSWRESRPV